MKKQRQATIHLNRETLLQLSVLQQAAGGVTAATACSCTCTTATYKGTCSCHGCD
ncbi:MAG TPA: hypothetical protein VKY89_08775 [Thermoanaerobaculia bacterium]|nr:hypothetical protein [Thermoanaerobaculia bacterium]